MKFFHILLLPLVGLFLFSCSEDQLVEVAPLEHDLLITWLALEKGDVDILPTHQLAAQAKWRKLRQKFSMAMLTESEKRSVTMVNLWMNNLNQATTARQYDQALVTILHLQHQLKTLRPRFGISHPADHLYAFNHNWERVMETSKDQMMCLLEWKEFTAFYELARQEWLAHQRSLPNHADIVFPGRGSNSTAVETRTVALTEVLQDFERQLQLADHTRMVRPSKEVKAAFISYLTTLTGYSSTKLALRK